MNTTPLLSLHDVTLRRGKQVVLRDVELALYAGERVVIAGPNGAGKSTLLAAMAGFLRPTTGAVRWMDRLEVHTHARTLAARRALVAQHANDAPGFLVRDVIELGRIPHARRGDPARDARAIEEAADAMGVTHLLDRPTSTLSGGQRQLVHMARALAQLDPVTDGLLLLDEPTASLDPRHAQTLLARASALSRQGAGVVAVLHDLTLAARFATRVLLVDEGRLVASGPPAEVLTPATLQRVYRTPFSVFEAPDGLGPLIAARPPLAVVH
jgi:iron complex transport system ATP-binding protein